MIADIIAGILAGLMLISGIIFFLIKFPKMVKKEEERTAKLDKNLNDIVTALNKIADRKEKNDNDEK